MPFSCKLTLSGLATNCFSECASPQVFAIPASELEDEVGASVLSGEGGGVAQLVLPGFSSFAPPSPPPGEVRNCAGAVAGEGTQQQVSNSQSSFNLQATTNAVLETNLIRRERSAGTSNSETNLIRRVCSATSEGPTSESEQEYRANMPELTGGGHSKLIKDSKIASFYISRRQGTPLTQQDTISISSSSDFFECQAIEPSIASDFFSWI